jgi:hypothetical protein
MGFEIRSERAGVDGDQTRYFVLDSGVPMASNPRDGHKTLSGVLRTRGAIMRSFRESLFPGSYAMQDVIEKFKG